MANKTLISGALQILNDEAYLAYKRLCNGVDVSQETAGKLMLMATMIMKEMGYDTTLAISLACVEMGCPVEYLVDGAAEMKEEGDE